MYGQMQFAGDVDVNRKIIQTNRTGAALAAGDVVQRDFHRVAAESTDVRSSLSNVTTAATANLHLPIAVATEAVADDAQGRFAVFGLAQAAVNGALSAGDDVGAVNAQKYLAAPGDGEFVHATVLEDNSSGTNVVWVYILPQPYRTTAP